MSWFADLAGKAESLLNNLDEQTGVALRNHNVQRKRNENIGPEFVVAHNATETNWAPKKRPVSRNLKKTNPIPDSKSFYAPSRKSSPTSPHNQTRSLMKDFQDSSKNHQARSLMKDNQDTSRHGSIKSKKSPSRRSSPGRQFNLDHSPKTLVGDVKENDVYADHFGLKHRRFSLPSDLELLKGEEWTYKMQNMEVENAMLKNELNVMNREVAELLDRLRRTEDGNDVDSPEVTKTRTKYETSEVLNHRLNAEKQSLTSQVDLLKTKIQEQALAEVTKYKDLNQRLEIELPILRSRNAELEQKYKEVLDGAKERDGALVKLENEMRHAQSTISDLQNNLVKSSEECKRLERDWEAYKLRVKNMLQAKDNEIKKLQDSMNITEDTKQLIEQMDNLKEERDELSEAVAAVRTECSDMKLYLQQVEARNSAAERVVAALRDALREERASRNKADAQYAAVTKEMKAIQMESGQTIASLRLALRDKEHELHNLRNTSSTVHTTDTSALNVGDYDVQDTIDNDKICYLTQTLVLRQTKIDSLLAENNMLRIQLEKVESKFKSELSSLRTNFSHSVVHLSDGEGRRSRPYAPTTLSALSVRLGVMTKRYPIIRVLVMLYMVGLHFWVLTVLFTSTPVDYVPASKS